MAQGDSEAAVGAARTDRLDSWKEIAVYLNRDVRTVQRWEKTEALPVHRHVHEKLGTVYAYKSEIEAWRNSRQLDDAPDAEPQPEEPSPAPPVSQPAAADTTSERRRPAVWVLAAVVVLLTAVLGYVAWQKLKPKPMAEAGAGIIVVLPFENLSGDANQEYFSDGMTEELIVQLGRLHVPSLQVIAVDSSKAFKNTRKTIPQIGAETGAGYVVQGSVRRSGQRVRIAAHLVRARDDAHLWDESYDRDLRDILSLQTDVAVAIANGISANLAHRPSPMRAVNPDAYEAYLKGRFFWNKRTPDDLNRAIENFEQATNIDPTYAPAYVGLADCYLLLGSAEMGALPPRQAMPLATKAAQKALQLDPQLAEAHASLAHIKLIYDWDWAGAEQEFRRAIELNPGYATAHQWYALYLNAVGRTSDALAELNQAREIDPLSPSIRAALSEAYYFARQYEPSVVEARKALEIDPNFVIALLVMGRSLEQQGKLDEAIAAYDKGRNLSGKGPAMTMYLARAYALKGDREKSRELLAYLLGLQSKVYVSSLYVAGVYTAMGDKDNTLKYAEKAVDERCEYLIYLDRDPMADPVRSEARFEKVLRAIGIPSAKMSSPR
jgi:TolB-like protein/Tfp pilus assembly protein PilF